jgi:hypothetical protein
MIRLNILQLLLESVRPVNIDVGNRIGSLTEVQSGIVAGYVAGLAQYRLCLNLFPLFHRHARKYSFNAAKSFTLSTGTSWLRRK